MIIKKIENPKKSATKKQRITALIHYILSKQNDADKTKCVYAKAKNFVFDELHFDLCLTEMIALSQEAVRSKDTVNHYIFSWKTETPTTNQVDDCVNILLAQLGMSDHQVIYALHSDTDNAHLHIVVNKVHPETLKVKSDFQDIHPMHKAAAILDDKYGWQTEENALYTLKNKTLVYQKTADKPEQKIKQRTIDKEIRTGEKSAQRIAIESINAIIQRSTNWHEFHTVLSREGMRYEKKGSGALIYVNDIAVKASAASRQAGLAQLQKRFGEFKPRHESLALIPRKAEPTITVIKTHSVDYWQLYQKEQARLKTEREILTKKRNALYQQLNTQKQRLIDNFIADKQRIYAKNLTRKNQKAAIGFLAYYFAIEKCAFEKHKKEVLADFKKSNPIATLPKFSKWKDRFILLAEKQQQTNAISQPPIVAALNPKPKTVQKKEKDDDVFNLAFLDEQITLKKQLAEFLKNQLNEVRAQHEYQRTQEILKTILDFSAKQVGNTICYYDGQGHIKFADVGNKIVMESLDKDALLAMMQLSDAKFGAFFVNGSDEFKLACAEIAAEYQFKIKNPELQDFINQKRDELNHTDYIYNEDEIADNMTLN